MAGVPQDPNKVIQQLLDASQPNTERMGTGGYTIKDDNKPYGWDADTLANVMNEMGMDAYDLDEENMDYVLNKLEEEGARNNDEAIPILEKLLFDPNNSIKSQIPAPDEDGPVGYWDAQHRGDKHGNSLSIMNGQFQYQDPIGKSPSIMELLDMMKR